MADDSTLHATEDVTLNHTVQKVGYMIDMGLHGETSQSAYQAGYQTTHREHLAPQEGVTTKPCVEEKQRIQERLKNFNTKDNMVMKQLTQQFGPNIKQPELRSIADVVSQNANIKLDRDAKRRKTVLIKWFDENWDKIKTILPYVILEEKNTNVRKHDER